jgi:aryl-alcohol dehydrogenase-like predicted oxidoreductase
MPRNGFASGDANSSAENIWPHPFEFVVDAVRWYNTAMKTLRLGNTDLEVTRIGLGCMPLGSAWDHSPLTDDIRKRALTTIHAALDQGIAFFDHADIYCRGKSEQVFAGIWGESPNLRQRIVLQSKCGIRFADDPAPGAPHRFDFSYEHIMNSVEGILKRLQTDYLDVLLLHRQAWGHWPGAS